MPNADKRYKLKNWKRIRGTISICQNSLDSLERKYQSQMDTLQIQFGLDIAMLKNDLMGLHDTILHFESYLSDDDDSV